MLACLRVPLAPPGPLLMTALVLSAACAGAPPEAERPPAPDADGLRASFTAQIAAVDGVGDVARDGTGLAFSGPDGAGGQVAWRVSIDSAVVAAQEDAEYPYRGNVLSSWYADGEAVVPVGNISNLPSDFLNAGIAQECWGLWSAAESRWTW